MSCRLCKNDEPLQNSHVIPEFLYGPSYDEKHRIGRGECGFTRNAAPSERNSGASPLPPM